LIKIKKEFLLNLIKLAKTIKKTKNLLKAGNTALKLVKEHKNPQKNNLKKIINED